MAGRDSGAHQIARGSERRRRNRAFFHERWQRRRDTARASGDAPAAHDGERLFGAEGARVATKLRSSRTFPRQGSSCSARMIGGPKRPRIARLGEEVVDEQFDILFALSERGNIDGDAHSRRK